MYKYILIFFDVSSFHELFIAASCYSVHLTTMELSVFTFLCDPCIPNAVIYNVYFTICIATLTAHLINSINQPHYHSTYSRS